MWVTVKAHIAYSYMYINDSTSLRSGKERTTKMLVGPGLPAENHIVARGRVGSVIFVSVEHKLPCNLPVQYNVVKSSQVYVRFGTSLYCIHK